MSSFGFVFKSTAAVSLLSAWQSSLVSGAGVLGVDGQPLSGSFDPTKCRIDRDDDQFKSNENGGQCARCITNDQCRHAYGGFGWYCCPFMKRCVNSGSMGCNDTAFCKPRCFGEKYPELIAECSGCDNAFPDNWIKGCHKSDWAGLVSGEGGSNPVPSPVREPSTNRDREVAPSPSGGSGGGGSVPDWCEWCLEDELPSDRCLGYKTELNWCSSGYSMTMREKCSRTCGYCDGCPAGTAEANKRVKDSAPTRKPTEFKGTGKDCRPDRKFTGDTDFRTACGDWKRQGYCDTYKDLMYRDCADTCGLCTHPGKDQSAPVPIPSPTRRIPASQPSGMEDASGNPSGSKSADKSGGCTCDRYNSDGSACQEAIGCEWNWSLSKCIPIEGTCESIRSDGQLCSATPGCEWDWDNNCCMTSNEAVSNGGVCQQIGSEGATCVETDGCRWDWNLYTCVASEDQKPSQNDIVSTSSENSGSKHGRRGGRRGGKRGKASATSVSTGNLCTPLRGKRCTKNTLCYLDGKMCLMKNEPSVGCERLPRKLCKGACRFDRASRTCVAP